jgi:hypothetical protein
MTRPSIHLDALYPRCLVATTRLMVLCHDHGIDAQVHCTTRTREDQIQIYGKERWTLHYIGLAVDVYPVLGVKQENWKSAFDHWPHWNLLQCDLAVQAGFDAPAEWQLASDRSHVQMLCGCEDAALRKIWYESGNIQEIWDYISSMQPGAIT